MKPVSIKQGNKRLLALADLLEDVPAVHDEGDELRGYRQSQLIHPCGSPACAWGHWYLSSRSRKDRIFKQARETGNAGWRLNRPVVYIEQAIYEFRLTPMESDLLFENDGCGYAETGAEAAEFIRKFVKKRSTQ